LARIVSTPELAQRRTSATGVTLSFHQTATVTDGQKLSWSRNRLREQVGNVIAGADEDRLDVT
jgi:hypothetical protein